MYSHHVIIIIFYQLPNPALQPHQPSTEALIEARSSLNTTNCRVDFSVHGPFERIRNRLPPVPFSPRNRITERLESPTTETRNVWSQGDSLRIGLLSRGSFTQPIRNTSPTLVNQITRRKDETILTGRQAIAPVH
jgi:hypothetical protein